ncbi:MAG: putative DNA primase/helicase [Paracoccaceae bacterium]|jgi:putative DNA primase/helicase
MEVDWQEFDAELRARVPELVEDVMGPASLQSPREWRWGRQGSLSIIIAGAKAGVWFDHELGEGGGFVDLVAREYRMDRRGALRWTADRIGFDFAPHPHLQENAALIANRITKPALVKTAQKQPDRAILARRRAEAIWVQAKPAPVDHPYLRRKQVGPNGLRCDGAGNLIVPLRDTDGVLHTIETITPAGNKRYLAGGAKAGHFCVIGGPIKPTGAFLICEGWATGASLSEATGLPVVVAMDAGNLVGVANEVNRAYPDADITIVADNDDKPGRDINPGVSAATKAAVAVAARLAIPPISGDANDLAVLHGAEAVVKLVASAALVPPPAPSYLEPDLLPDAARLQLAAAIEAFMAEVPVYWAAVEEAEEAGNAPEPLDFNLPRPVVVPPLLGLPVETGLGKTSTARAAIANLLATDALTGRKVIYAVPRHDLGQEQVVAFQAMGLRAMLWKGRGAPDPSDENPDRLMCLDPEAVADALEIEQPVEQSCCKVRRDGEIRVCLHHASCGYQRQKEPAQAAQVIVCSHDSLFHIKPEAIRNVGLLVIDEAFWQSGLRGLDGKAVLTQDGLEPGRTSVTCYQHDGKVDVEATADLTAARHRLWKALQVAEPGPLKHGLLTSVGLTAEDCRVAATLERRRLRNPGLLPGMGETQRRKLIDAVLPPHGQPWSPPGRCAALWIILAKAIEDGFDAGGAVLAHQMTENGSVRALNLRWRGELRGGWAGNIPVLHLDATLRPELVTPYLPYIATHSPLSARLPHVEVRQVLCSPTSAKALTPVAQARERDQKTAKRHLRDLLAYISLRARQCHRHSTSSNTDLLIIGQKAAIDALRAAGLPPRVDAVHFNGLSGLDRWGDVGGLVILGRTLPAPATVEAISAALTGRVPATEATQVDWWYGSREQRIRLEGGKTHALQGEVHADLTTEAIRWSICEGELVQAMGRGRGVNRTAGTPLSIDLLVDTVLPVTVREVVNWSGLRPSRRDLMAARGVVLDNAADMAVCFADLWSSRDIAKCPPPLWR